jgi:flagellar hook-length control protein FliK
MSASETAAYGQAETSVSGDPGSRNLLSQVPLRDLLNALSAKPGIDRSDISSEGIKRFLESAVSYLESAREISHRRGDEAMAAKVDKATNSMRTLLKLNDMYAYAEVPVKNEDENRKTHLRFFANKKTRIRKDEGTSAVLHLNMPSLKELDIKMVLKGNSLKIDFFSSKEASPLLEADSGTLSEKLRMIGVEPALDFKERIENNPELDPSNLPGSEIVSSPLGIKGFDTRA